MTRSAIQTSCRRRLTTRSLVACLVGCCVTLVVMATVLTPPQSTDEYGSPFERRGRRRQTDPMEPPYDDFGDVDIAVVVVDERQNSSLVRRENGSASAAAATGSQLFESWTRLGRSRSICGGRFRHHFFFALLIDEAVLDRERCVGARAVGGESVSSVLNQSESAEFFTDFDGCFELASCAGHRPTGRFAGSRNPLNLWLAGLNVNGSTAVGINASTTTFVERAFTVALTRFDYANFYFVVNDWYNVFLMARFFDRPPESTRVLLVDAHPRGLLDDSWSVMFGGAPARQLAQLPPGRTRFAGDLVWSLTGSGPLAKPNSYAQPPPLVDDFHRFVVGRHGLPDPDERKLNCRNVSVLFVWRRDYVAHPRNPKGTVKRKIGNERELIDALSTRHGDAYTVRGVQLDLLSVGDQLRVVGEADVLVGMHGAGLGHVLFMPRHGALVELRPFKASENPHFADLALWRRMLYRQWKNTDRKNEVSEHVTRIPVDVIDSLLNATIGDMCAADTDARRISAFQYHEALRRERRERTSRKKYTLVGRRGKPSQSKPTARRTKSRAGGNGPRLKHPSTVEHLSTAVNGQRWRDEHNKWLLSRGVTPLATDADDGTHN